MRASEKVTRKYRVRSHESGPHAEVDEISSSVELGVRAWLREELVFIPKAGDTNVRRMKKRKINDSAQKHSSEPEIPSPGDQEERFEPTSDLDLWTDAWRDDSESYSFCCAQRRSNTTGEKEFAAVSQQRSRRPGPLTCSFKSSILRKFFFEIYFLSSHKY
ncbi:hypothetical protein HZH66_014261 [Vespula vulgaris]|uniref:Uncharacterized protein n=1 Tax=Vespula vulgaris TaxID=7454 RepID=A0A834MQD3_VESVU|nr:hypothetical protein HZH66_014261 [Vespula vulgaris]